MDACSRVVTPRFFDSRLREVRVGGVDSGACCVVESMCLGMGLLYGCRYVQCGFVSNTSPRCQTATAAHPQELYPEHCRQTPPVTAPSDPCGGRPAKAHRQRAPRPRSHRPAHVAGIARLSRATSRPEKMSPQKRKVPTSVTLVWYSMVDERRGRSEK